MKNKFLLFALLLILVGFYVPATFSQIPDPDPAPTYTMSLGNDVIISTKEYRCDVYITRTGTTPFELNLMQIGLTYNNAVKGAGTFTVSWLAGSTNPVIAAAGQMPTLVLATNVAGYIKMAGHVAAGGPGTGAQITTTPMKVGTLRFVNTVDWVNSTNPLVPFNLDWSFGGSYATKLSAYAPTDFKGYDITTSATHNLILSAPLGGPLDGPLPVELSSFTSAPQGRTVVLNWSTKTEKNSNRFDVERSLIANSTWSTVASVKASVLSNSTKNYSYSDTKLQSGKYQYRLKMVDNDGSFSYSSVEVAEVSVPKDFAVSQNYPNPFNPTTKIDYQVPVDAKVIMEVYNIAGQKVMDLVNQQMSAGYYTVDFGASMLSSGVYIYRLVASDIATGHNFSSIKKMMLLK